MVKYGGDKSSQAYQLFDRGHDERNDTVSIPCAPVRTGSADWHDWLT